MHESVKNLLNIKEKVKAKLLTDKKINKIPK